MSRLTAQVAKTKSSKELVFGSVEDKARNPVPALRHALVAGKAVDLNYRIALRRPDEVDTIEFEAE